MMSAHAVDVNLKIGCHHCDERQKIIFYFDRKMFGAIQNWFNTSISSIRLTQ